MISLLPSILDAELSFGRVESIAVPAEYVDALVADATNAASEYLIPLIVVGDPGVMILTIAGRDWPYGGL